MTRILLYGATGYMGRLIAREAIRRQTQKHWWGEMVLASRDLPPLRKLSESLRLPCIHLGLDDRWPVVRALEGFDVLINAAGPYARTAVRLAKAALDTKCHYVDLSAEPDVYQVLDDLAPIAARRGLALVSGAGWSATASGVLLQNALTHLKNDGNAEPPLHSVRIAHSSSPMVSRASAQTLARGIREQVAIVRGGRLTHVPVGQLERTFLFGPNDRRIATAVNLLDLFAARRVLTECGAPIDTIECYAEMSQPVRWGYEFGALGATALHLPYARQVVRRLLGTLPNGPNEMERRDVRMRVVVEIENAWREIVARWVLKTPNPYDFSAGSVVEVALGVVNGAHRNLAGWLTPAAVLSNAGDFLGLETFSGCELTGLASFTAPRAMAPNE